MFLNIFEILKSRIVKKTVLLQYANYNSKKRYMPDFQLKNNNVFKMYTVPLTKIYLECIQSL